MFRSWRVIGALLAVTAVLAAGCADDDGTDATDDTEPAVADESAEDVDTEDGEGPVSERNPTAEPAILDGPITVGEVSRPADPRPVDLDAIGYTEEEFFASGTATAFAAAGELTADGHWEASPSDPAPYATRMIVRRPSDPDRFSGVVLLEWLNVTAVEAAPGWAYGEPAITDAGAAWVGLSTQAFGVVGGTPAIATGAPEQAELSGGIRESNPERYGSLEHPGDRFAFDIHSQVGAALRSPGDVQILGGGEVTRVVAMGQSQSAGFLTTYINAIQPVSDVFDGFFVHSRGAGAAQLGGERAQRGSAEAYHLRTDLDVPILVFETETDVGPLLRFAAARQPDTPRLRIWEAAGTAHADAYLVGREFPLCPDGINDGPQHYVVKAAIEALIRWIEDGTPPPQADPIETTGDDGTTIVRDELGLARGGIRTPSVEVPVSELSGEAPPDTEILCALFGSSTPFDAETLSSLYDSREAYLERFDAALDEVIEQGFVRAADREEYAAEARVVELPG